MTEIATKDLLMELNELRKEKGMKPLKAWKESRAKLEAAIDKLDNEVVGDKESPAEEARVERKAGRKRPAKKKPDPKKKPTGKKRGPQPKNDGLLSVSDIAREIGIDPKVARAKLRRYGEKPEDGRWPRVKPNSKEHKQLIETMKKGTRAAVEEDIE